MAYNPKRDWRFEYIWDLMDFIETNQCNSCGYKSDRDEYAMCFEVEAKIIEEEVVESLDDHGNDGVVCTKYRNEVLVEQEAPEQSRLF